MKPLSGRIERERDKKRRVDDVRGPGPEKSLSPCRPLSPPIRLLAGAGILPVLPVLPVLLPALSRERARSNKRRRFITSWDHHSASERAMAMTA